MPTASSTPPERARKIASLILARVKEAETQAALATVIGISPATMTRLLTDHLDNFAALLAHAGLKAVPAEYQCVDKATYDFMTAKLQVVMREAPQLIWDADA